MNSSLPKPIFNVYECVISVSIFSEGQTKSLVSNSISLPLSKPETWSNQWHSLTKVIDSVVGPYIKSDELSSSEIKQEELVYPTEVKRKTSRSDEELEQCSFKMCEVASKKEQLFCAYHLQSVSKKYRRNKELKRSNSLFKFEEVEPQYPIDSSPFKVKPIKADKLRESYGFPLDDGEIA